MRLTMLVVDDEWYALKGITKGIDWSDLPIDAVFEAESVAEAKRHLERQPIDLLISDIEMPEANGLELLRYIRESSPQTLTIFLTGHARFEYAQDALQLGCFDYVLKPVDHAVLKAIVARAIEEIGRRREQAGFEQKLEEYRRQWSNGLPLLVDRFWSELLEGRMMLAPERLNRELSQLEIPLTAEQGRLLPILLSVEHWNVELDARDEAIMEYALRKAAAETILGAAAGAIVQDSREFSLGLLYLATADDPDRSALRERCEEFVQACLDYFHCRVSCYVGSAVPLSGLPAAVERLLQLERANVTAAQSVIDTTVCDEELSPGVQTAPSLPSFLEWSMLLDSGRQEELIAGIASMTDGLIRTSAGRETLELCRFGMLHMLYQAAFRAGMSVYDALDAAELADAQATRTPQALQAWMTRLLRKFAEALQARSRDSSAIIVKVQTFIQEHLQQELTRDDIARSVYRNPAYVSRLFRKETGLSLTDYIAHCRIELAKRLLTETNDKISRIAEDVSYTHFSYFAKLFKKTTGLSPQEYRKKHQVIR